MKNKTKISIILAIFNIILLIILWFNLFYKADYRMNEIKKDYISSFNFLMREQINDLKGKLSSGDYSGLNDMLSEIKLPKNYEAIIIFNEKGKIIASFPQSKADKVDKAILTQAFLATQYPIAIEEKDKTHLSIILGFNKNSEEGIIGGLQAKIFAPHILFIQRHLIHLGILYIAFILLINIAFNYLLIKMHIETKIIRAADILTSLSRSEKNIKQIEIMSKDEFSNLFISLNNFITKTNILDSRINDVINFLKKAASNTKDELSKIQEGVNNQTLNSEETISTLTRTNQSLPIIIENISEVEHLSEITNGFIFEMQAALEQLSSYIEKLIKYLDSSAKSTNQIALSINDVSNSIDELSSGVSEIVASTAEMDYATKQVELNSKDAYQLSINTMKSAETGSDYVLKTIDSINEVKKSIEITSNSIDMLIENTEAVSKILLVIKEITEQTNLLSLNASILAAQAGEHGRSFAVVANEIKNLAEKTANSTKEIKNLIAQIRHYTQETREAMNSSEESINMSIQISSKAGDSLKEILSNVKNVVEIVQLISSATTEQSRGSKQITEAMERIAEMTQNISSAVTNLSKAYEQIDITSGEIKSLSYLVKSRLAEDTKGQKDVSASIEKIASLINAIKESISVQKNNLNKIYDLISDLIKINNSLTKSINEINKTVNEINAFSEKAKQESLMQ
jgi:methyl-accepting chemotaxis protein